jgi:outer membrane protein assembly factor BamA
MVPQPSTRVAAVLLLLVLASSRAVAQENQPADRDTVPQRDLMDVLSRVFKGKPKLSDTAESTPKVVLSLLPSFSASPSVGLLIGISGNALLRLGPPETTSPSTVSASVSYTTKKQFNVLLRSNLFTNENRWKFEGDWRYLDTNQPTYGLGPIKPSSAESPMDFKLVRLYETVYREAVPDVLVGVGYHMNAYFDIVDRNAKPGVVTPFLAYNRGQTLTSTTSSGVSINVLTDGRDNPINASKGLYARASFRSFPQWMGSDDSWQSLELEFRSYPRISHRSRLAFWGFAWFTFGHVPYLDLPAIGWDYSNRTGRGYAQGRIRSQNMAYGEAEYRVTLSASGLWGAAAFINLTSTSGGGNDIMHSPDPAAGLGLRIKLNKHSASNITIDYGFGREGASGLFLGTGEAF